MAVNTGSYLKSFHDATIAAGDKAINSDFTLEIEGYESVYLLCKQAPWPELSPQGEIEVPTPLGGKSWQAQQVATAQQSQVSFYETTAGAIDKMLVDMLANGGRFNAKVYEGTPDKYLRYKQLQDCFLQLDVVDRDWENRSQPLMFSGTMFYHYFGDVVEGNTDTLNR